MADIFEITGRIHSTSQEHVVVPADEIKDETQGKKQNVINADVAKHENDIHGDGGINDRLDVIEAAESITYGDENTGVTPNGSDFTNPDATKRAKVPTVGAVLNGLNDGVYDVSKRNPTGGPNSDGKFTLEYILNNANTLIPTSWRHGGMIISFVQSSDNKYVQYRCLLSGSFTDTQFVRKGSWGLVKSTTYGIIELYLLPNSGIGSIHLVYRNNSGKWSVVFFSSTDSGSMVATTIEYTSESAANGILPIYKYTTSLTNEVVGYIIVDWTKFNTGANGLIASVPDYAYNLHNSPSIENYLLSVDVSGIQGNVTTLQGNVSNLQTVVSNLDESDIAPYTVSKKGVKELYLLPDSGIGSVHLVYKNSSGKWFVKFLDSPSVPNNLVAQTTEYTSEAAASGILPIYKYTTELTSEILGYIIIDWGSFSDDVNVYKGIPTDKATNLIYSPSIENYLLSSEISTLSEDDIVPSTVSKKGVKELYLLPNSGIGSVHLVYRNSSGKWYVSCFDSANNGNRVASTIEYTSESAATGVLPLYKYTTSITDEIVGYIIIDWEKFSEGSNVYEGIPTDKATYLLYSPSIANYLLSSEVSTLEEDDIISDTISKKGVKELYLLPNSGIGSVHLVYRNNNGRWYVVFLSSVSGGNKVASTIEYTSEAVATGVLPIYEYTTEITSTIVGYIIVNWEIFQEGSNTYKGIPTDKAENIEFSPIINNYLQAEDSYLEDGILNAPVVIKRRNFELGPSNVTAILNNAFMAFGRLCRCHWYDNTMYLTKSTCMDLLKVEGYTEANMIKTVNHNLRNNVLTEGMSYDMMARRINYFLTVPAIQFCDAKLNNTDDVNFSLPINLPIGEPSTVVSEDGSTMYVYCGCVYRYKTTDGVNYTLDRNIKLANVDMTEDNPEYLMHCNVNLINGIYYLIGTNSDYKPLVLWTSTNGINFTKVGIIMNIGDTINQAGDTVHNFGNTFLYKDPFGKWYLYYELSRGLNVGWETALATCDDILNPVWEQIPTNPIFANSYNSDLGVYEGHGNPAFAVGENNLPIKQDGKYYIYLHGEIGITGLGTIIWRYYSTDLINWVSEGKIIDYRDIPHTISNGDMCFQQFKGRTYQFYTYDINPTPEQKEQGYGSQIRVLIDDRPFVELLKLRP